LENLDYDDDDDDEVDVVINRDWESIRENRKASATESLITIKHGVMRSAENYLMKESKLTCSSCRIQVRQMKVI
jgi:hypothetical protein